MDDRISSYTSIAVALGAVLVVSYLIYLGTVYRRQIYIPKTVLNQYIKGK